MLQLAQACSSLFARLDGHGRVHRRRIAAIPRLRALRAA